MAESNAERQAEFLRRVDVAGREPRDLKAMYDGLMSDLADAALGCKDAKEKAALTREFREIGRERGELARRLYPLSKEFPWAD